ncbi:uncharacterized protein GBIM_01096, partial [Gryllus bimaculatus]
MKKFVALDNQWKMASLWLVILATALLSIGHASATCSFHHTSFPSVQPLILADNKFTDVRRIIKPDSSSQITVAQGEYITLVCPGPYNYLSGGNVFPQQLLRALCVSGSSFSADGRTIDVNQVACYAQPTTDVIVNGQGTCGLNTNIIQSAREKKDYLLPSQIESFTLQLGAESAEKYINSTHYLEAKQLVPGADFVFSPMQLSTFFYFNTVPLWNDFISVFWSPLESSIRQLTYSQGELEIYTGIVGVATLPDSNGRQGSVCAEDVCAQLRWLPWRHVPAEERPFITCCRADDPVLLRHLPVAFARGLAPST